MALHSLYCADVPLRNCSLTHSEESCSIRTLQWSCVTYQQRWHDMY